MIAHQPPQTNANRPLSVEGVRKRGVALVAMVILLWCAAAATWLRPPSLVEGWMGWRQADTQSIARHFAEAGSSIWYPQINWGGDGPGYVETEFQLYPELIAPLLRVFGDVEWPGQLLSLLFVAAAAWVIFTALDERYGTQAAALGAGAFLCVPSVVLVSTKVQPEALCLLFTVLAWRSFLRYFESGGLRHLALYGAFGTLAMLVKPTAAQIGVASFVALALGQPRRLRSGSLWATWLVMLLTLGAFLWHGTSIYREYHNTFGVLAGGDTKLPKLRHLLLLGTYRAMLQTNLVWGLGALGSLAATTQLLRKKLGPAEWGLVAGMVVWSLVACRYICVVSSGGSHYVILASLLAAHCVAAAAADQRWLARLGRLAVPVAGLLFVAASALTFIWERHDAKPGENDRQAIELGRALANVAPPGGLVVVRSVEHGFDQFWGAALNFEDPRPFYLSHTHGWVLPSDETDATKLARFAARGARYYAEPGGGFALRTFDAWLETHATLVATTPRGGRVFNLNPEHPTSDARGPT